MADDATTDPIVTGALFVGGGVAAYLGGRWLAGRLSPRQAAAPAAPVTLSAPAVVPPSAPDATADAAPVSSPSQVDKELAPTPPSRVALPRHFDPLLERHRGDIPIEYLRALAMRESGMDPNARSGSAWGLLQIIEVVRMDYNKAHRTRYTRGQLLDPEINVSIATWLVRLIVESYRRNHSDVPNLRRDWNNPRFAELVTCGWNAGWTEAGGVGRVVGWLKAKGARDIDLDLVHEHARDAGASKHLRNAAKVSWCKSVVALYQRERALVAPLTTTPNT
jgi:hypothetical protein